MDIQVYDRSLQRIDDIDVFKSLIWTDRYSSCGDFELVSSTEDVHLNNLQEDFYLMIPSSEHVMIVETKNYTTNDDSDNELSVTGRSLESMLDRRIIWDPLQLSGNFQNAVKKIINDNIIAPKDPNRKIPNFVFKESTDPTITELTIDAQYHGENVYDTIVDLCDFFSLGFKITINNKEQFVFELYRGINRSYSQEVNPYVMFSPSYDNLSGSNHLLSTNGMKTAVLVGGEEPIVETSYDVAAMYKNTYSDLDFNPDTGVFKSNLIEKHGCSVRITDTDVMDFVKKNSVLRFSCVGPTNGCSIKLHVYGKFSDGAGSVSAVSDPDVTVVSLTVPDTFISATQIRLRLSYKEVNHTDQISEYSNLFLEFTKNRKYVSVVSDKIIGLNRRETFEDASDLQSSTYDMKLTDEEYDSLLRYRGGEVLIDNSFTDVFDGKVNIDGTFKYPNDFGIGDIVQLDDGYSSTLSCRISEMIISEDETGTDIYPSLIPVEQRGYNN